MSEDRDEAGYGSGRWIRTRTDDELRGHIDGNMPGNMIRDACLAELRHREAGKDRAEEMKWIKRTFWVATALGILGIVATVVFR